MSSFDIAKALTEYGQLKAKIAVLRGAYTELTRIQASKEESASNLIIEATELEMRANYIYHRIVSLAEMHT